MYKKVVVLGGGTGISYLLRGLKDFPVDITAVITVSDNGRSTGKLREEFHTPAVGDIRKVITSLSEIDDPIKEMISYRFNTSSDLDGHAVGNLILTAMLDITGSLKDSITSLSKLLDVRHTVLPISEDSNLTLVGEDSEGNIIEGEEQITNALLGKEKDVTPCTLSMSIFRYDALLRMDRKYEDFVLNDIDACWFSMLQKGATAFWETALGNKDFDGAGSLCHGWSALPIYYYHKLDKKANKIYELVKEKNK